MAQSVEPRYEIYSYNKMSNPWYHVVRIGDDEATCGKSRSTSKIPKSMLTRVIDIGNTPALTFDRDVMDKMCLNCVYVLAMEAFVHGIVR